MDTYTFITKKYFKLPKTIKQYIFIGAQWRDEMSELAIKKP